MRSDKRENSAATNILVVMELLVGLTATVGGVGLIVTNGFGMPLELLKGTPFSSYIIPGLVLALVVGASNLIAAGRILRRENYTEEASEVAGLVLLIWIFAESYILKQPNFFQIAYFGFGILILALTFFSFKKKRSRQTS